MNFLNNKNTVCSKWIGYTYSNILALFSAWILVRGLLMSEKKNENQLFKSKFQTKIHIAPIKMYTFFKHKTIRYQKPNSHNIII